MGGLVRIPDPPTCEVCKQVVAGLESAGQTVEIRAVQSTHCRYVVNFRSSSTLPRYHDRSAGMAGVAGYVLYADTYKLQACHVDLICYQIAFLGLWL